MTSTRKLAALLASLIAAILACAGCGKGGKNAAAGFQRPPAAVTAVAAIQKDVPVYLDEIGRCVAREMVSIQPQVSGRILERQFQDGADVKAGQLLFTIDPRPYKAQLDAATGALSQAKAALELARTQLKRAEGLIQTQAISQQEFDNRKSAVDVAAAQVEQGEAAVETARLNLQYCTIRSPIDGRTGQRLVDVGNIVTANTGSLLTIQKLDPIYADFTVTENDLTAVQKNMSRGTLRVEIRLPDEPDKPVPGDLTFLDNAVADASGTVKLRATARNADHRLWPGRFVQARLVLSTIKNAVLVPSAATQMSAKGPFVYVVTDYSTADLRPVTLGQRQGDLVVVQNGVRGGERVVVNGQLGVTPGGKVHVAEAAS